MVSPQTGVELRFERTRKTGIVREVAPGIHWIRIPLPFPPYAVNAWALRDGGGWTVVDTGAFVEEALDCWRSAARDLGAAGAPVRLLVTHAHPDHCGSAGWFARAFGASLLMSRTEWLLATMYGQETQLSIEGRNAVFYGLCGADPDTIDALVTGDPSYRFVEAMPPVFRPLRDGETIVAGGSAWTVMIGEGHSLEHVCLHSPERNILIAGDHLLPRIVPTIGVNPFEPDSDPLNAYLRSLPQFRACAPDVLVLPGHGTPFVGLHARIDELESFYEETLAAVRDACHVPATVLDVVRGTVGEVAEIRMQRIHLMEAAARLSALVARRQIRRAIAGGQWLHERV